MSRIEQPDAIAALSTQQLEIARAVRDACLAAAIHAHENARMDGLCHEGAWECAMDALRALDLAAVLRRQSA